MKWSPGCQCCGGGGVTIPDEECCERGPYFGDSSITNFTMSKTGETWTQNGASYFSGTPFCSIRIPVTSSVNGSEVIEVTYGTSYLTGSTPAYSGGWTISNLTNALSAVVQIDASWIASNDSVSGTDNGHTASWDFSGVLPCGCLGTCPYEADAISNLEFTYLGTDYTQSLPSRFSEFNTGYGAFQVEVSPAGLGLVRVLLGSGTFGVRVAFPYSTSEGIGTFSGCGGTSLTIVNNGIPASSGITAGTIDITSSGNCTT